MKYQKQKGLRIKNSRFDSVINFEGYWFDDSTSQWLATPDFSRLMSTHSQKVRSLRAFRRRLKQWKGQLPKGTKMFLVSRFVGHDITGVMK